MKKDNFVIKNKTPKMGKEIIKYLQYLGVDTGEYDGHVCESLGKKSIYYGVINGMFNNYTLKYVKKHGAEIIELPVEKQLKRGDLVYVSNRPINLYEWDDYEKKHQKRIFLAKIDGSEFSFISVHWGDEQKFIIGKKFYTVAHSFAVPVPEEDLYTTDYLVEKTGLSEVTLKKILKCR